MEELGKLHQLIIPFFGYRLAFNLEVIAMTWIVIAVILVFGYLATRKCATHPNMIQTVGELITKVFYDLTEDALGPKMAKTYAPLVTALFMFLVACNWIGIVPHLEEPTKDLNTTLSLGVLGFVIAHYVGIKTKGIKTYLLEYCEPMFLMAPLNIIGEVSKIVSISFRIFGNIMGGAIIIMVVSYLCYSVLLPPFLWAFFGIFVGAIQAFVFTILTVVYISVQAK